MIDIPHRRAMGLILGVAMAGACSEPRPYTGIHDNGGANGAGGVAVSVGGDGGRGVTGGGGMSGMSGSGGTPNGGEPGEGGSRDRPPAVGGGGVGGLSATGGQSGSGNGGLAGDAADGAAGQNGFGGSSPCAGASPPTRPSLDRPMRGAYTGSLHAAKTMATLRPTFAWKAAISSCGMTSYEIQIDDSCSTGALDSCTFPSPEVDMSGLSETSFTPTADLKVSSVVPVGAFYAWRVRACDNGTRCSPWSETRYVRVGRVREDITGDGYGDLLGWNGDGFDVYLGSGQFDVSGSPGHVPFPDHCAFSSSFLGDVNGDGFGDFLMIQNYAPSAGCVPVLFYGGKSIQTLSSLIMAKSAGGSSAIINAKSAGDFNGDGYDDVIVQWGYANASPPSQVRLFLGGQTLSSDPDLTIPGPYPNFEGFSDSGRVGDVNGDGYEDIGLLAFDIAPSRPAVGKLQLFFGGSKPDSSSDADVPTAQAPGKLGRTGDVDGDGLDDLVVLVGQSYAIVRGGLAPLGPLATPWSDTDASSILGGFDLNGDHLSDFALGRNGSHPLLYLGVVAGSSLVENGLSSVLLPIAASSSDHDGDGRQDLVFIDAAGGNAEWVGNDGTISPRPRQIFSLTGDVVR